MPGIAGCCIVIHPRSEGAEDQAALFPTSTPCCNIAGSLAALQHTRNASEMFTLIFERQLKPIRLRHVWAIIDHPTKANRYFTYLPIAWAIARTILAAPKMTARSQRNKHNDRTPSFYC